MEPQSAMFKVEKLWRVHKVSRQILKKEKIIPLSHVHLEKRERETNILQKIREYSRTYMDSAIWNKIFIKTLSLKTIQGPKKKSKGVIDWFQTLGRDPQA